MRSGEAFLDIVWRQFRRNRAAYWSLWLLAPIFLMATFAPLIASNLPLVFHDGSQTTLSLAVGPDESARECRLRLQHGAARFRSLVGAGAGDELVLPAAGVVGPGTAGPGGGRIRRHHRRAVRAVCRPAPLRTASQEPRPGSEFSAGNSFSPAGRNMGSIRRFLSVRPRSISMPASSRRCFASRPIAARRRTTASCIVLGTDKTGRDVLVEMLYGTRISMTVGFIAVGIYLAIGVVLGAVAGFFGGKTDMLISRVIEVVMLFPIAVFDPDARRPDRPQRLHHHGGDRHHRLAQHRPTGARRSPQAASDRIHVGRAGARFVEPADRVSAYSAQCVVAGFGGGAVRHRQRHHYRGHAQPAGIRRRAAHAQLGHAAATGRTATITTGG